MEDCNAAKRSLETRRVKVEDMIRANKQELQEIEVHLESMNINVPELPMVGTFKTVCSNCHHRGHRNQQNRPCVLEKCSSFTYCGIKDKHPEYFSEINRMKCAAKKKNDVIKQLEQEVEGKNFPGQSEHQFMKALTPRMMILNPE